MINKAKEQLDSIKAPLTVSFLFYYWLSNKFDERNSILILNRPHSLERRPKLLKNMKSLMKISTNA